MGSVIEIENAVTHLSVQELAAFRKWFQEFVEERWDAQIRADSASGKLDLLANEAIKEHERGLSRDL